MRLESQSQPFLPGMGFATFLIRPKAITFLFGQFYGAQVKQVLHHAQPRFCHQVFYIIGSIYFTIKLNEI